MRTRYFLTIILIAAALATAVISYRHIRANMPMEAAGATTGTAQAGTRAGGSSQGVTSAAFNATSAKPAGINFTLSVGGQNYNGTVSAGAMVMDAMHALQSSDTLTFSGKDYPGMGFFVESINGRKNSNGLYWILYINGEPADAGASQTTIHSGDNFEWRYEKSN